MEFLGLVEEDEVTIELTDYRYRVVATVTFEIISETDDNISICIHTTYDDGNTWEKDLSSDAPKDLSFVLFGDGEIDKSIGKTTYTNVFNRILPRILERFPNTFPLLRHILGL